ncbi:MAG: hypothetical protein KF810_14420 [Rhizobiaceae bacterium]|nr:hypothetical protein [Rhizobiaceae bacterium]
MTKNLSYAVLACVGLLFSATPGSTQDAIASPATKQIGVAKTQMEPSLIVMNSAGAMLADGQLVLSGVTKNSIVFADRPIRAAGHVLTTHLIEEWATGSDSFAKDPPNATVSVLQEDAQSVADAVVTLRSPKLEGDTLTFDVDVLEGNLDGAKGPASVFIDIIGMPRTPLSFAGAARRTAYRGAWYAGAAAGAVAGAAAVAASPYYRPACGYYPYPPCY